jgi:hypothetical protein
MLTVMRLLALSALVLAIGVAACGGTDEVSRATWSGPSFPYPDDGILPVEDFRSYADAVDAGWEHDPAALAREFVGKDGAVSVNGTEVTLLRDGLEDDSVRAERFVLDVEREGDVWSLVAARWEQRCQERRGHQEFSPELCV